MKLGIVIIVVVILLLIVIAINFIMKRKGYSIPGETIVRCSKGHLFTTMWIEGGSLKAIRLGPLSRFQYCPIGKHWAIIHPIKRDDLSSAQLKLVDKQQSSS